MRDNVFRSMNQRSPVHEIVSALWRSLHDLRSPATTQEIERWGFSIHGALSASGREFHNHDHVLDLVEVGDPIEGVAALYHDAVYIQVDQGPPRTMRDEITSLLAQGAEGWRVLPAAGENATAEVLAVFGRKVGDLVGPMTGLNELASALVAAVQLAGALDRAQRLALFACIEQTIPFRIDPVTELRARLVALGLSGELLDSALRRAVRFGNRDVQNFGENEGAQFLDNTWRLLPETNPALHAPEAFTVTDYRIALQKMEGFLAWLPAERVFHTTADEPTAEIHARRVARTKSNLALAVRYLRAKLYSIGVVEALAEATGGDVPLDYFMGGKSQPKRIEQFLPEPSNASDRDPLLYSLLAEGRTSESSFDTVSSPLAAYLHATVGEVGVLGGVELAKQWWGGSSDATAFLASQPARPLAAIARAAANIMEMRRDRLLAVAEQLER